MFNLLKWAAAPVLAVAMMGMDAPEAKAIDGFRVQIGGLGISSGYRSYRPSYGYNRGYRSYYGGIHHGGIHYGGHHYGGRHYGRPHYDYHPPSLVPHGNHLDYVPGHYDLHYGPHHGHRGHHRH